MFDSIRRIRTQNLYFAELRTFCNGKYLSFDPPVVICVRRCEDRYGRYGEYVYTDVFTKTTYCSTEDLYHAHGQIVVFHLVPLVWMSDKISHKDLKKLLKEANKI